MPLQQCFHLLLELHTELVPVTLVLSMDEKGSKQVDVLDVQPAAAAREQIAAAVFEWQLGLHNTMLARFLPPLFARDHPPLSSMGGGSECGRRIHLRQQTIANGWTLRTDVDRDAGALDQCDE